MNYIRITDAQDSTLGAIKYLYEQAFPERERRDFSQLLNLLEVDNMQLVFIEHASLFIGFFIQWELEEFNYIEHIAIDFLQRGKNYGSAIMEQIIRSSQKNLLLEVEPAQDDISKKRILFYERLGLRVCSFDYNQPPYRKKESAFPMLMMSYPQALSKEDFDEYTSIIKAEVYERI